MVNIGTPVPHGFTISTEACTLLLVMFQMKVTYVLTLSMYALEAVFHGTEKSAIEISLVGSSPVVGGDSDVRTHTPAPAVPAFTASGAIVVLGLLAVVYARRRRHS